MAHFIVVVLSLMPSPPPSRMCKSQSHSSARVNDLPHVDENEASSIKWAKNLRYFFTHNPAPTEFLICYEFRTNMRWADHGRTPAPKTTRRCAALRCNKFREIETDLHLDFPSWMRGVVGSGFASCPKRLWFDPCRWPKLLARCRLGCVL